MDLRRVLTIAGSDPSGGAGVQADLKTFASFGLYGESAIASLTAQNTCGVYGVLDVPPAFLTDQIDAVFSDIRPDAVKVGMLSTAENVRAVAEALGRHGAGNVVVDPVMVATSGGSLMRGDAFDALVGDLLPVADVVTPNLPEAVALAGLDGEPADVGGMVAAARAIARLTPGAVLVKGGHLTGGESVDVLLPPGAAEPVVMRAPRVDTANTHGTGCTLSSAIACGLAEGMPLEDAVRRAKAYVGRCLAAGLDLGKGGGPMDHMAPWRLAPAGGAACRGGAAGEDGYGEGVRALVVGGSPVRPAPGLLRALVLQADVVVACDSGADACREAGIRIDVLVGDLDSVSSEGLAYAHAQDADERLCSWEKDDTDLGLAVAWLRGRWPAGVRATFTGVCGGRADHGLAVWGLLARAADLQAVVEENDASYRVLVAGSPRGATWRLRPSDAGRTASVVALAGGTCVSEEGMHWDLDHAMLDVLDDLGVSNIVVAPDARVTVHGGCALVALLRERDGKGKTLRQGRG